MRHAILFVLGALSCVRAGPESSLQRGTLTRPPPAPTRPGVGAPVFGQPGASAAHPRGTDKRVLPPAEEPGLWSGDTPSASRANAPGQPEILGVALPFIPDAATAEDERPTRVCGGTMSTLLSKAQGQEELAGLPPPARRCLAARLYVRCTEGLLKLFPESGNPGGIDFPVSERRIHLAADETAKRFRSEACAGVVFPLRAEHAIVQVIRAWAQRLDEGKL
jgi:hypothetical protein